MKRILFLLLFWLGANAFADLPFTGRLFTDQYLYTNSGQLAQSSLSTWLDYDTKTEKGWGTRIIGEGDVMG